MTRRDLAARFAASGFTRGAEIGVERGKFAEVLCRAMPGLVLLAVDAWESRPGYREHVTPELWTEIEQDARARLRPYGAIVVKARSTEAARAVPDGSLDFIYVDGDHAEASVVADLAAWASKVRTGGVVAGHDWNLPSVKRAVQDVRHEGVHWTDERSPSWWFTRA